MGAADEQPSGISGKVSDDAVRIKFLCSHGGKILPKPDGQLRYVGGDTRLVSFSKSVTFADLCSKLEKLFGPNLCLKYQLPNEDLDTLISVTCDDDVENLVEEYDKNEARDGSSRLRAFLFPRTGASVPHTIPCICHTMEDAKSHTVSTSPPQVADCGCPSPSIFQMPDYLRGLESAGFVHGCLQQHADGDHQPSPICVVDDKGFLVKSMRPISPTAGQHEQSRHQSFKFIESSGRGPALTTSALGPLTSSHHQHTWDRRKFLDEGMHVNQRGDEKRHVDLNIEVHHHNYQQDGANGVSMVRVSSKDRLAPGFMEVSSVDTSPVFDRQLRPLSVPRADVHPDVMEDARQDGHHQGNSRHYKPLDMQKAPPTTSEIQWGLPQSVHHHNYQQDGANGVSMVRVSSKDRLVPGFMEVSSVDTIPVFDRQLRPLSVPRADAHPDVMEDARQDGHHQGNRWHYKPRDMQKAPTTTSEIQWGLPQSVASAFHTVGERSAESGINSGDSDEGSHRKMEGHSGADGMLHSLPGVISAEGPHGLKMQESYRLEDPMVQQLRHGELEQVQYDHPHHVSKSHFQSGHRQLHEPQEQQQHQMSTLEPVRIMHNVHGLQRHGHSLDYHAPPAAHHHHMIPGGICAMPRSDPSSVPRLPSPLYRQAASPSASRVEPPKSLTGTGR